MLSFVNPEPIVSSTSGQFRIFNCKKWAIFVNKNTLYIYIKVTREYKKKKRRKIMADLKSVQTAVNGMLGMKFGSYGASKKALDSQYCIVKGDSYEKHDYVNNSHESLTFYVEKNGEKVAVAGQDQNSAFIYDHNNDRTYYTTRGVKSDKFQHITCGNNGNTFIVNDTNGNGYIDENDTVNSIGHDQKFSMTIRELLDGNF